MRYNDIAPVNRINYIERDLRKQLIRAQKLINSVGLIFNLQCGRIIEDKLCLGKIARKKKSGLIYCKSCKAKWKRSHGKER